MRKAFGKICCVLCFCCASWVFASCANAGVHFNLNVNVGSPGYYGPLPIVTGMVPQLWNVQPVIAVGPVVVSTEPYICVFQTSKENLGENIATVMAPANARFIL